MCSFILGGRCGGLQAYGVLATQAHVLPAANVVYL